MKYLALLAFAALLNSSLALADTAGETLIGNLPDEGAVSLSGSIDKIESEKAFLLRDSSGTIEISIASGQSLVLKPGEKVRVTGSVHRGFFGFGSKSVEASDVEVDKDFTATVKDAVTQVTGVSFEQAKNVRVSELPDQGLIKLTGSVDSISGAKSFTLKDATGNVDVKIDSGENVALMKGAEVTVIGYVDNGMLGKTIHATHVIVSDNALPTAGGS